jgi:hypothetical protein
MSIRCSNAGIGGLVNSSMESILKAKNENNFSYIFLSNGFNGDNQRLNWAD